MTLDARRFGGNYVNDYAGRERHGSECVDSVVVAGATFKRARCGRVIYYASFGAIRAKEIKITGTSMTLGAARRYDGWIFLVPMSEPLRLTVCVRGSGQSSFLRCVCERDKSHEAHHRSKQERKLRLSHKLNTSQE